MLHVRSFVFLLASVVALAGCAGEATVRSTGAPTPSTAGQADAGAIEGSVLDAEMVPLDKARVQILAPGGESPQEFFTGPEGKFRADNLAPGTYQVTAFRLGFREAAPKKVDVVADEVTQADFVLDPVLVQKAFVDTRTYTFYFTLNWCFPEAYGQFNNGIHCQALGWDGETVRTTFNANESVNGPLMTIVHEMEWTTTVPQCSGGMKADVYSPQQDPLPPEGQMTHPARSPENPYHWENEKVTSTTKTYIPRLGDDPSAMLSPKRTELNKGQPIVTDGKWGIVHWSVLAEGPAGTPAPVGCIVDQKLNGWLSLFYVDAAPGPEWSIFDQG